MFTERELDFLRRNELCRLATVRPDGKPHVVPICYIFENGAFYMVTDLGTAKLKNIKSNSNVALLVDVYKPNRAILVEGDAEVLLKGEEFKRISKKFIEKFEWAKRDPWDEEEAAVIKVIPKRKVSWGLARRY